MQQTERKQFAAAQNNGDFTRIETRSGATVYAADPLGPTYVLPPDASEKSLGLALLDCLSHSRFLPYEENRGFFDDRETRKRQQDEWISGLMTQYKYKSRRALFSGMDLCTVEKYDGKIHILPHCHVRSEIWDRRTTYGIEDIVITDTSSPSEVGKALGLAFARCITE